MAQFSKGESRKHSMPTRSFRTWQRRLRALAIISLSTSSVCSCRKMVTNLCDRAQIEASALEVAIRSGDAHAIDNKLDPWGHPYRAETTAGHLRVFSVGRDGVPASRDDVDRL